MALEPWCPEKRISGSDLLARLRASQLCTQVVVVAVEALKLLFVLIDNEILIIAAETERVIAADAVLGRIDELHSAIHILQDSVMRNPRARTSIESDPLLNLIDDVMISYKTWRVIRGNP